MSTFSGQFLEGQSLAELASLKTVLKRALAEVEKTEREALDATDDTERLKELANELEGSLEEVKKRLSKK